MNSQNNNVVVVMPLKSPVIGFVLAFFLGWLGVDRFYKGNVLLGIIKLIGGLIFVVCGALAWVIIAMLVQSGSSLGSAIVIAASIYLLWYVLDLILVPLGISMDNKRKLAQANGTQLNAKNIASQAEKVVQKPAIQSSVVSNTHSASTQMSIDNNQSKDDLVTKIISALILLGVVIVLGSTIWVIFHP